MAEEDPLPFTHLAHPVPQAPAHSHEDPAGEAAMEVPDGIRQ